MPEQRDIFLCEDGLLKAWLNKDSVLLGMSWAEIEDIDNGFYWVGVWSRCQMYCTFTYSSDDRDSWSEYCTLHTHPEIWLLVDHISILKFDWETLHVMILYWLSSWGYWKGRFGLWGRRMLDFPILNWWMGGSILMRWENYASQNKITPSSWAKFLRYQPTCWKPISSTAAVRLH